MALTEQATAADPDGVCNRTDQGDLWCAGGQCKRVNIGIALVTNPRVLFLDEPTSGLDSYTSNEVMTVVKGLTRTGITICATIHNPTPYCFNLFDRLMILLHGRVVYSGENGARPRLSAVLFRCLPVCLSVPITLLSCGVADPRASEAHAKS